MSWVVIALSSAALAGVINILEKTVLVRYIRSPLTLPFLIGLAQVSIGTILILALPWPKGSTLNSVGWSLASGVFWGFSGLLLFRMLYSQEVSRTILTRNTFPIFTALIAFIFLDEQLSSHQWVAIVATVIGAALLSVRQNQEYRSLFLHPSFFVLMVSSVFMASSQVTGKISLEDLPVLNVHGLRSLVLGVVFLLFSLRPVALGEVRDLLRRRSPALPIITLTEVVLGNISLILAFWALSLGPVSLVTAVVATRSFFVVFFSTALALRFSGFLGEQVSAGVVAVKAVSTALIVAGVIIIALR